MNDEPKGDPEPREGSDLSDLRSRLDALHGSVERLGREPEAPPAEPAEGQQPQAPYIPPGEDPTPPYGTPADPAPYNPGVGYPVTDPAYAPYEPPAPDPAQYGYETHVPVDPYAAAPAATNGQSEADLNAVATHIAILDVGPFADLIELRHFEEAVARLEAVRDVRVRRFGHRRAMIELGLDGPYAIGRELYRLGRPMEVEPGPDGEVIVDFTDVPDFEEAQQLAAAEADAPSTAGEEDGTATEAQPGDEKAGRTDSETV